MNIKKERMLTIARSKAMCEFCPDTEESCLTCSLGVSVTSTELRQFWADVVEVIDQSDQADDGTANQKATVEATDAACATETPKKDAEPTEDKKPATEAQGATVGAQAKEHAPYQSPSDLAFGGFLVLECEHCHEMKAFRSKVKITEYTCEHCKQKTKLHSPARAYTACRCGNEAHYTTNTEQPDFDIPCIACGTPCTVRWSKGDGCYMPLQG